MSADTKRGAAEMSAAMLISGTIGWFVLMCGQSVMAVVFWRCFFGALTLTVICAMFGLFRRQYFSWRIVIFAILGGVAIVINWLLLFAAYSRASISIATIVYNTQPFMLLGLGAIFLKDRITPEKLFWLALSFAGMIAIVGAAPAAALGGGSQLVGIAMALGAAFFYAIAALIIKTLKETPPHLIALIQVITGVAMLAPLTGFAAPPATSGAWSLLITLGVVHTGIMYVLLYGAIQKLPIHLTGALSFIYPIAAVIVDRIAFGHALHPIQFLGSAAILIAAAGMTLGWGANTWSRVTAAKS